MAEKSTAEESDRGRARYPLFKDPEGYLRLRQPGGVLGVVKNMGEHRALGACLRDLGDLVTVLDIPCGPGRLFPYYRRRGLCVTGADFGTEMLAAAVRCRAKLGLAGGDCRADAFCLPWRDDAFDCVISVRFAYYFERLRRLALLEELARVASRGIVVQVKIAYGMMNVARRVTGRAKKRNRGKLLLEKREILADFADAGLEVVRIAPLSHLRSDRAFVAARPRR